MIMHSSVIGAAARMVSRSLLSAARLSSLNTARFFGWRGGHPYRYGLFPPITMLQDVMREHIAPWDKGDKNDDHQAGFYVF